MKTRYTSLNFGLRLNTLIAVILLVVFTSALVVSAQDIETEDDGTVILGGTTNSGLEDPNQYFENLQSTPYTPLIAYNPNGSDYTAEDIVPLANNREGIIINVQAVGGEPINVVVSADPSLSQDVLDYVNSSQVYFDVRSVPAGTIVAFGITVSPLEQLSALVIPLVYELALDGWQEQIMALYDGGTLSLRDILSAMGDSNTNTSDTLVQQALTNIEEMISHAVEEGTLDPTEGNAFLNSVQEQYGFIQDTDAGELIEFWRSQDTTFGPDVLYIEIELAGLDDSTEQEWFIYYAIDPYLRLNLTHLYSFQTQVTSSGYDKRVIYSASSTLNVTSIVSGSSVIMRMWSPSYYDKTRTRTSTGKSSLISSANPARCYDVSVTSTRRANQYAVEGGWQPGRASC